MIEVIKKGNKLCGSRPKPFLERKVLVYGLVKRMYAKEVQEIIKELVKPYR